MRLDRTGTSGYANRLGSVEEPRRRIMRLPLRRLVCLLSAASAYAHYDDHGLEQFDEDLTLTPLPDGKLLTHFEFTTQAKVQTELGQILDYGLFPKAIGEVLQQYDVDELHLTFTQGRWDYEEWGYPPQQSAGTGVELWAWMKNSPQIDDRWQSLTNVLSGLFCASLNFIDKTLTTKPILSFVPEPIVSRNFTIASAAEIRYGSLPHENVCTENLTPWIKLLPCKAKSGIAVLLNPHKIYNSNFHSMGIHTRSTCADESCSYRVLELKQTIVTVTDPVRETSRRDWSLEAIFDRRLKENCPVAHQSRVWVEVSQEKAPKWNLKPTPNDVINSKAVYDLQKVRGELDIRMSWNEPVFEYPLEPSYPMIYAHRYFTGYGQERGGLRITLHNRNLNASVPVVYFDSIPWFLKLYLHTLKVDVLDHDSSAEHIIQQMYYQPAIDRDRPTMLECRLLLPPQSVVTLSLDFDKVFLRYTEHRPDANRGFDVG
ncbi:hypothetical protein EC973_003439 [Apophysomyces ossiformis]|uniref:GPI transamidase component PIG-T n=1 Tax=Apophysomyces ossiformis TaxID=679940 RepID=A0A8H7BHA0_9FUNG|nr:hypothetical protein EC973_003439 [Apophysomyces ossiformis]